MTREKLSTSTSAVFQQVLGSAFTRLPPLLQRIHSSDRAEIVLRGRCSTVRGRGLLVGIAAWLSSLPATAENVGITVAIRRDASGETWTRHFGTHEMKSRLWAEGAVLTERLGAMTFRFRLEEIEGRIEWRVCGARFLGLPLPASWFSQTVATEQLENDRYTFAVRASLPLLGPLITYRGWLVEHE
jgi:hypothetical protein